MSKKAVIWISVPSLWVAYLIAALTKKESCKDKRVNASVWTDAVTGVHYVAVSVTTTGTVSVDD